jgi:hypothetical protein
LSSEIWPAIGWPSGFVTVASVSSPPDTVTLTGSVTATSAAPFWGAKAILAGIESLPTGVASPASLDVHDVNNVTLATSAAAEPKNRRRDLTVQPPPDFVLCWLMTPQHCQGCAHDSVTVVTGT